MLKLCFSAEGNNVPQGNTEQFGVIWEVAEEARDSLTSHKA